MLNKIENKEPLMSRRRHALMSLLLPLVLPLTLPAAAQTQTQVPASAPAALLDATARREIVGAFARAMRERYVFPERGEQVAVQANAALASGKYDGTRTVAELASKLSADAAAITHDKHLTVFSAQPSRENRSREDGPARSMPAAEAGVTRADKLLGGAGYIEVIGFPPLSFSKRVIDMAMSSLSGSRALIIDVRRNGGGDPESVAYLVSFLIQPGRPINDIVSRLEKTNDVKRQSFRSVRTPVSFVGVPVYVLTSGATFSGGEEFAYDVQALKRGTLIGETTGGGANPVGPVNIGHGVTAMIPFARAENPITKSNWEGVGVKPAVSVPASTALRAALTRVNLKPVDDINAASTRRVFSPRTIPLPASEAAARKLLATIASGGSLESIASPQFASMLQPQLAQRRAELASLGELRSVDFYRPDGLGGDEYKLTFAGGRRKMALVVDQGGKIVIASPLAPLESGE